MNTIVNQAHVALNPYLPGNEYIPDAEPHIFDNRVYIYGSHDKFGAPIFCVNDYVTWSAPLDDLSDWRYEGVIYKKNQDPKNKLGIRLLFAPDVCQGPDGRFYLYYAFDFMGIVGVAAADKPAGPFEFLGHVHYADGTAWGRKEGDTFPFDPAVLVDDDNRVYLYSGFYTSVPAISTGFSKHESRGGVVLELESDMVTIKTPEKLLFPKKGEGSFTNHEFFEASSIRKFDGRYYFVYSSRHNHELCYAVSDSPTGGFVYGGTLVSNGDVFLNNNTDEKHAKNYTGNTHGGMLRIDDAFYIFYHRQTNLSSYARQACAEKLSYTKDKQGIYHFAQAEMTSCGLNDTPLPGKGVYEARIACNLWADGHETGRYDVSHTQKIYALHPRFTQDEKDGSQNAHQYIAHMHNGATAGFKYFAAQDIAQLTDITVRLRASQKNCETQGMLVFSVAEDSGNSVIARIPVSAANRRWTNFTADLNSERISATVQKNSQPFRGDSNVLCVPLYARYEGTGSIDFSAFELK